MICWWAAYYQHATQAAPSNPLVCHRLRAIMLGVVVGLPAFGSPTNRYEYDHFRYSPASRTCSLCETDSVVSLETLTPALIVWWRCSVRFLAEIL